MNILLPTDFSENAILATKYAIKLAKKAHGHIVALHAYDVPHYERSLTTSLHLEMKEVATRHMSEFEQEYLSKSGVSHETLVRIGNPIRLSKNTIEEKNIDLVVMGTKGASGIEEFLIGSNAASIIQNVDIPVMIIPENATKEDINDLVLATDFEFGKDLRPVHQLKQIADLLNAKVSILHIQNDEGSPSGSRDKISEALGDTPHDFTVAGDKEDVEKTILKHCEKSEADAVAAIAKSYGFFERLFHKSLTSKLAYHSKIPMIALKEPKK